MNSFRLPAAMFLLLASMTGSAAEVPLSDFAKHEQFRDLKISPEGDYLAASAVVDGKTILSLIRLSDMQGVNLRPRADSELAEFWWVAPHRLIYTVGESLGELEAPVATGELYAVNADGSGAELIFGQRLGGQGATHVAHGVGRLAYGELIDPLLDDPKQALIASYPANGANLGYSRSASANGVFPEVLRIDLFNGATYPVTTSPLRNARFMTDNDGVVRFAFGNDADQAMKVWYRAGDGKPWEPVFDENKDHLAVTPMAFDRKQDAVYFDCGGEHNVGGLCRWDIATRKLSTLWSGTESGIDRLVNTFDDKDIIAIRTMPGRTATTLLDKNAPEAKLLVSLMQQFPGEDVRITSHTRDAKKAVVLISGDTDPGQFFLYDQGSRKLTFLLARRPWIKPDQMASMEPITLKARDGLLLHGYLTRPPGRNDAKNLPLVVFVHGGPYYIRDRWAYDPYVQALASRGYAVLQVNYRGSGDYGLNFVRAGFRQWGGTMQDDVTDATRWAIAQGVADPKRVCIFGGSYGGYAALEGAVKEPDLYRCAIGYVGVYDLRLMHTRGDIPQSVFGENYLKMVLGEDESVLWDRSPVAHVDRLKAKVMIIVGGADRRVPPVQGESLHSALSKAHVEHEWLYQRTEGHGFYEENDIRDLLGKIVAFLDANIGAKDGASTSN
ncbi:MAG TPA: S9 family peptidase [Rhodanobacteraceae bacterium]|nr:S9 family peptidase [Rhodanobacteraceae bacterium]